MVNYVLVQRVADPRNQQGPKKFYAQVKSQGEYDLRAVATEISKRTGISVPDVIASNEALIDLLPELVSRGLIVRLGDFGSFSLSISSEGTEKEEEFTAANIKDNSLNFHPGKVVQKVLKVIEYKKA